MDDENAKGQLRSNYWAAIKAANAIPLDEITSGPVIGDIGGCRVATDGDRIFVIAMRQGGNYTIELNPIAAAMLAKDLLYAAQTILPGSVHAVELPPTSKTKN